MSTNTTPALQILTPPDHPQGARRIQPIQGIKNKNKRHMSHLTKNQYSLDVNFCPKRKQTTAHHKLSPLSAMD